MNDQESIRAPQEDASSQAECRGSVYGFLAWLLLENPDASFLDRLLHADLASYVASLAAGARCHPMVVAGLEEMRVDPAAHSPRPLDRLSADRRAPGALLFGGMGLPPPYESANRLPETGAGADILPSLQGFYREAGAGIPVETRERLDHLGMELDFMRFLCEQEAALWRSNDAAGAARYRGIQRRFLASHLMAWAPDYCQMVLAEPCPLFAQGLAKMVSGFLANDAALLARWAEGAGGTRS